MKNLYKYTAIVLAAFFVIACDPLEDTLNEVEEIEATAGSDRRIDYTMTEDDYVTVAGSIRAMDGVTEEDSVGADFIEDNLAFNTDFPAKDYLGSFVSDLYPALSQGTAVKVSFNLFTGNVSDYDLYLDADNYVVSDDDYTAYSAAAGLNGFYDNSVDIASTMSSLLTSKVQDPAEGDIVSATYNYVDILYSDLTGEVVFEETFPTEANGLGEFTAVSELGDNTWFWEEPFGTTWVKMSGFRDGANKDWLVSSEIDLSDAAGEVTLKVNHIWNFKSSEEWGTELDIRYSTDSSTWTSIAASFDVLPEGGDWDEVLSSATISGVQGEKIYLAFYYESTEDDASTWEIVDVNIEVGAAPEIHFVNDFYEFDGDNWSSMNDDVHYLGSMDYEAMGAPGRFNNFSSSDPSSDYVPAFLLNKFPFAQEEDEYDVVFRYFDGGTSTLAETYTFSDGIWTGSFYTEMVEQYVHDGTSFVFDPSVILNMVASDYQIIVDVVKSSNPELLDSFGTTEYLYGAGSYFANFDLRADERNNDEIVQEEYAGLSDDDATALMIERMGEGIGVMLAIKYAADVPVAGLDVFYTVNSDSYDGEDASWVTVYQLVGTGEFNLVSGPEKKQ